MPNRIIRESITTSHSWDQLSFPAEAFCTRLITVVDDFGRMDGRPSVLRAKCYPLKLSKVTDRMVAQWLADLIECGLVMVYVGSNGGQYIQFINWTKYQNVRAKESKFPAPCEQEIADAIKCDQVRADVPVTRYSDLVTRISGSENAHPAVRDARTLDEERAYEDGTKKGYSRSEIDAILEDFRDYWDGKGWRDKDGPVKDVNARFRRWVKNQVEFGHPPSGNGHAPADDGPDFLDVIIAKQRAAGYVPHD